MKAAWTGLAASLIAGSVAWPAGAEVVSAIASEQSHGQAWTFRMPAGCFAALPWHVAADAAGGLSPVLLRSRSGREGQGLDPVRPDPQLDLVFVRVAGALGQPCGSAANLGVDNLDYKLVEDAAYTLHVTRTRSLQQIPLRASRNNRTYVRFALQSDLSVDEIAQSMSGGVILSGDDPVGMLLSVDNEDGLLQALRFDVIKRLARSELSHDRRTHAQSKSGSAGFAVASWHGESIDADKPPSAALEDGTWRVRPVGRRVELVLHPREAQPFSGVQVARAADRAEEPDLLTMWTSGRPGADWVLLKTCARRAQDSGPLFDCRVGAREVGALRLDFARRDDAPVLSIGPIRVY